MTRAQFAPTRSPLYAPDTGLIKKYALRYRWDVERLTAALTQFGNLPIEGQERLIGRLVVALGSYQLLEGVFLHLAPSGQVKRLRTVESTVWKLLREVGINEKNIAPSTLWESEYWSRRGALERVRLLGRQTPMGSIVAGLISCAHIDTSQPDLDKLDTELVEVSRDRIARTIEELLWLQQNVKAAIDDSTKRAKTGRGGARRYSSARGQLIRDAIVIYADLRRQYPKSGNEPGLGEPMRKFVRSVGQLFGPNVMNSHIDAVWRAQKSKQRKI